MSKAKRRRSRPASEQEHESIGGRDAAGADLLSPLLGAHAMCCEVWRQEYPHLPAALKNDPRVEMFCYVPPQQAIEVADSIEYIVTMLAESRPGDRSVMRAAADLMVELVAAGYFAAVTVHAPHITAVDKWERKRAEGRDKGHNTLMQAREIKYQRIRDKWAAMETAGEEPTNATVAAAVREEFRTKCSIRTVQRAFAEPAKTTTPAKRTKR